MCVRVRLRARPHTERPKGERLLHILQNDQNMALRQAGKRSNFDDDCGVWDSSKGKTTALPYMKTSIGEYKRLFVKNGLYGYEHIEKGCRMFDPVTPQPDPEQLFLLGRYYTSQKGNPSYRKWVTWVDQKRSDIAVVAVCEYIGASQVSQPLGNTNHSV